MGVGDVAEPRIVAMGGGGFSMEASTALDDYLLGLTGSAHPRVCFVGTASGDADGYITRFYHAFRYPRAIATHLPLFKRDGADIEALLLAQDLVYVSGGNTVNLLAIWRAHGVDRAMRRAWEAGVVLCGLSAGSLCWYEGGVTDSYGGDLAALPDGLGFLPGSHCPHYDGEPQRRPTYRRLVAAGELPSGIAADDGVGLLYVGTELREVVTSRPGAQAHRVEAAGETPIPARPLSPAAPAPR